MKTTDYQRKHMIAAAKEAISSAQERRAHLRRRTRPYDPHRRRLLKDELERLAEVMTPIRSEIGRLPYFPIDPKLEQQLRETSKSIQRESLKLKKMLGFAPWN